MKINYNKIQERDSQICDDETYEIQWFNLLRDFEDEVFPIFQKFGYSKEVALQCFILDCINSHAHHIKKAVQDDNENY